MDVDTGQNGHRRDISLAHVRQALRFHFGASCAKAKDSMDAFTRVQVSAMATAKDYIVDPRRFMFGSKFCQGCPLSMATNYPHFQFAFAGSVVLCLHFFFGLNLCLCTGVTVSCVAYGRGVLCQPTFSTNHLKNSSRTT